MDMAHLRESLAFSHLILIHSALRPLQNAAMFPVFDLVANG